MGNAWVDHGFENLLAQLFGPPIRVSGNGVSYWACPGCGDPGFHSLPDKPGMKRRAKCHKCGLRGDKHDMTAVKYPWLKFPQRQALIDKLMADFRPDQGAPATSDTPSRGFPTGMQRVNVYSRDPREEEFSAEADAAIKELLALTKDPDNLALARLALELCCRHGLHPLALAGRLAFEVWTRQVDAEHMASCADTECDWRVCRLARGWTPEQIRADVEAGIKRHREEELAREARLEVSRRCLADRFGHPRNGGR